MAQRCSDWRSSSLDVLGSLVFIISPISVFCALSTSGLGESLASRHAATCTSYGYVRLKYRYAPILCSSTIDDNFSLPLLQRIEGLRYCKDLTELYLYSNQISVIEGLEGLTKLTKLWLNGNRITTIQVSLIIAIEDEECPLALCAGPGCTERLEGPQFIWQCN